MSLLVVDANVAAKWLLPRTSERCGTKRWYLLERYSNGDLRFVVPDLFWAELGKVLCKAARLKRSTPAAAKEALATFSGHRLPTVSSSALLDAAFGIAIAFDRTVYDGLYVALAVTSKGQLVTADEKLANPLAAHLPVAFPG